MEMKKEDTILETQLIQNQVDILMTSFIRQVIKPVQNQNMAIDLLLKHLKRQMQKEMFNGGTMNQQYRK